MFSVLRLRRSSLIRLFVVASLIGLVTWQQGLTTDVFGASGPPDARLPITAADPFSGNSQNGRVGTRPPDLRHEILVLGMHHSATSLLSRGLILLGAYGGEVDDLILDRCASKPCANDSEHALKYWEQKDVVDLNVRVCVTESALGFGRGFSWANWGMAIEKVGGDTLEAFSDDARAIIRKYHLRSDVISLKDPRMALTMPIWRPLFPNPVCVLVYRHPLHVARGLYDHLQELSFADWVQLWENSTVNALRGCEGAQLVLAKQDELLAKGYEFYEQLYEDIIAAGVPRNKLVRPTRELFAEFLPAPPARLSYQLAAFSKTELGAFSGRARRLTKLFETARSGPELAQLYSPDILSVWPEDLQEEPIFHFFVLPARLPPSHHLSTCQLSPRQRHAVEAALMHHPLAEVRLYIAHVTIEVPAATADDPFGHGKAPREGGRRVPLLDTEDIDVMRSLGYRVTIVDDAAATAELAGVLASIAGEDQGVRRSAKAWIEESDLWREEEDLLLKLLVLYRDGGVVLDLDVYATENIKLSGDYLFNPFDLNDGHPWLAGLHAPTIMALHQGSRFARQWIGKLVAEYERPSPIAIQRGNYYRHVPELLENKANKNVTKLPSSKLGFHWDSYESCLQPHSLNTNVGGTVRWNLIQRHSFTNDAKFLSLYDDFSWRTSSGDRKSPCTSFFQFNGLLFDWWRQSVRAPLVTSADGTTSASSGAKKTRRSAFPPYTWPLPASGRDPFIDWTYATMELPRCIASRPWSRPTHKDGMLDETRLNVFLIWTTNATSFRSYRHKVVESVFAHHPTASVRVLSNTLPSDTFAALRSSGRDVNVIPFDVDDLFDGTPLATWLASNASQGEHYYSHVTDAARYALLWKYGGLYIDFDVILLQPLTGFRNALGYQTLNRNKYNDFVNGALLKFDRGHPFLALLIERFLETYDPAAWSTVGPKLLTDVVTLWARRAPHLVFDAIASPHDVDTLTGELVDLGNPLSIQLYHPDAFYPIFWQDALQGDEPLSSALGSELFARFKSGRIYAYHFWGHAGGWVDPLPGSLIDTLLANPCALCPPTDAETAALNAGRTNGGTTDRGADRAKDPRADRADGDVDHVTRTEASGVRLQESALAKTLGGAKASTKPTSPTTKPTKPTKTSAPVEQQHDKELTAKSNAGNNAEGVYEESRATPRVVEAEDR